MTMNKYEIMMIVSIKDGKYNEIGALASWTDGLEYVSMKDIDDGPVPLIKRTIDSMNPQEAVEYLRRSANGINWDISNPLKIKAASPQEAVDKVVG